MASSLAQQLAQNASLNTALLVDRSRRKPTQSYLFTSRDADQHDLDSIYALGANGFQRLKSIEPFLSQYEDTLFSDAAKGTDRTLQSAEANSHLDTTITLFLQVLGPYLLEAPSANVLEWLVRRFRIHEFNVGAVLAVFLPYKESVQFSKMLSILKIDNASKFSACQPFKSTSTPLSHTALADLMIQGPNSELARFVGSLLSSAIHVQHGAAIHRTLIAFHTGILLEFVKRSFHKTKGDSLDEGTLAWVLPAAIGPLDACASSEVKAAKDGLVSEVILSSYLLLSALSHTCPLSTSALSAVLKAVTSCARYVSSKQVIRTLASICAAQQEMSDETIPRSVIKSVLKLSNVDEEIKETLNYSGTERFVKPLVQSLVRRLDEERALQVLTALVTHSSLPSGIINALAVGLIKHSVHPEIEAHHAQGRSLLVHLQQRHPTALQRSFETVLSDTGVDKNAVEQLLLSLSVQLPRSGDGTTNATSTEGTDVIIASTSADSSARSIAVRDLYARLSRNDLGTLDLVSVRSALVARVEDTHAIVVEALYAVPTELLPILLAEPEAYVSKVARVLHSQSPSKALIKAHVSFVANHFYPAVTSTEKATKLKSAIFSEIFFPLLLFSKPRQKTAALVWDVLKATDENSNLEAGSNLANYELLVGSVEAVRWEEGKVPQVPVDGSRQSIEFMINVNMALSARISENIRSSTSFPDHLDNLLSRLQGDNVYARTLAYLVCRSLLPKLTGDRQIEIAHQLIQTMDIQNVDGAEDIEVENIQSLVDDASVGAAVVLKPTKKNTLYRLQRSILAFIPTIPRPAEITWLSSVHVAEDQSSTRTAHYIALMRFVYTASNSTAAAPQLSAQLIRAVLTTLGEDALTFLARIWLENDSSPTDDLQPAQYAALKHAAAYLEAHCASQRFVDFQVILPALFAAVTQNDRRAREAAMEAIAALARLSQAKKPGAIYAYDMVYGSDSADLQYLDWSDFCRYVQSLDQSREHLVNDPSYLRIFHQENLILRKGEGKKESGYKQRVLCYLLSHVRGCSLERVKLSILDTLHGISSSTRLQMLLPVLKAITEAESPVQGDIDIESLLLASFDEAAASALNDDKTDSWKIYISTLDRFFRPDTPEKSRAVLLHGLQNNLFVKLRMDRQIAICTLLLEVSQRGTDIAAVCKAFLGAVLTEVPVIVHLLAALQPHAADASQRAPKRIKVDSENGRDAYSSLTLLCEVLGAKPLPGSAELVSALLDSLSKIIHDTGASSADKTYLEQLLLSALENAISSIPDGTILPVATVRLDILVELIRVAENPQTFNQALLLVASLARLAPSAVLQNVMPVFTFMGSNVFHRDDTYSFKVVQKTIDSIVPVMTASLKAVHTEKLDLHISARTFLRIFTDAANHIPRHRRTSFFTHLVEVLGPSEFLAPICLLLVDRMSNRVVRQNTEDALASLSLPLAVIQKSSTDVQVSTLVDMLHEARRLLETELNLSTDPKTFLEAENGEDGAPSMLPRRQAHAIIIFAAFSLQQQINSMSSPSRGPGSDLLSVLLDIAVAKDEALFQASMSDISTIAKDTVRYALGILSAADFISGVHAVMESGQTTIQIGALELIAEHLPNVAEKARQETRQTLVKIVDIVKALIPSAPETFLVAAFGALRTITSTLSTGEEYAVTSTVPLVVTSVHHRKATSPALTLILAQIQKLGPRIIPYFKDIVKECAGVLSEDQTIGHSEAVNVLHALLVSIPNFWSSGDFLLVIDIYLRSYAPGPKQRQSQLSSFIKTVAKKAPSKVLLPTLCDLWAKLAADASDIGRISGFLSVLQKTIQSTERSAVPEYLRQLFRMFLEIFQVCASDEKARSLVEHDAISAFVELVTKINELTFKPLFRKLFDWAFNEQQMGQSRKLVFFHLFIALLDYFKSLMTPYMSFLLQPVQELLQNFVGQLDDLELWLAVIQALTQSFIHDEGAYWREDKLNQLIAPLVSQIPVCAGTPATATEGRDALKECLVGLAEATNDPASLKKINLEALMHTRSGEARVRTFALGCSEALWCAHGGKLIGFASETATFVAECAEDDNDTVVREAHRLKNAVEGIAGRIDV